MWKNAVFNTVAPDISFQNSFIFSWQKHNLDTKCKVQRYTAASPLSHSFHFSSFFLLRNFRAYHLKSKGSRCDVNFPRGFNSFWLFSDVEFIFPRAFYQLWQPRFNFTKSGSFLFSRPLIFLVILNGKIYHSLPFVTLRKRLEFVLVFFAPTDKFPFQSGTVFKLKMCYVYTTMST